ncbi:MAG: glycogen/starch/alpha-glucan family phosphorylase [Clostridia bacterium]|nr:glycogen/starch/alpha-glucan family phosphorylase [Clostridia bacterium]
MDKPFEEKLKVMSREKYGKSIEKLDSDELYCLIGAYVNEKCDNHKKDDLKRRRAAYFSIEYLIGRLLESNLFNMRNIDLTEKGLNDVGHSLSELSKIEDYAFGNGGLGRLAACFLDSAASIEIPLDGYGIRYKYGLFRQSFSPDGSQQEHTDDWQKHGDPFGIKKEGESVQVNFADYSVIAVPYDYHIIGYNFKCINTLRLYECQGVNCNESDAEKIYEHLYPDDSSWEGKRLRLRQQYFLASAALQNIVNKYGLDDIENKIKIQLNDTHPVIAIPEFINICIRQNMGFDDALLLCEKIFAYTNHTVMPEALEEWDCELMRQTIPEVYGIIQKINDMVLFQFSNHKDIDFTKCAIVIDGKVKMANLACYVCSDINGVASLHTEILKNRVLSHWYKVYPGKFSNKTNGITQRRWLGLSNVSLSNFLSELCGCDIIEEIEKLEELLKFKDDEEVIRQLCEIKKVNKKALCQYVKENEETEIDADSVFFVQVKRIHEYKRQLLGIFLAIHFYLSFKQGVNKNLPNMTFIFGGKAAASYKTAKSIIRFINTVAKTINSDEKVKRKIKVVFCENYNVSYAEKIIPAADISMQLSLAGTEASGTGNMKFMLNGAVTLGTYDGANIEICEKAGEENNYIFGMREDEVRERKLRYCPKDYYEGNEEIKKLIDTLVDGTFGEENSFYDIYDSLLNTHDADRFMVLADLSDLIATAEKALADYKDEIGFGRKCLMNIGSAAYFSSDRTVREYAEEIWFK